MLKLVENFSIKIIIYNSPGVSIDDDRPICEISLCLDYMIDTNG